MNVELFYTCQSGRNTILLSFFVPFASLPGDGQGTDGKRERSARSSDGDEGFGLLVDNYQEPLPGARAQLFLQYGVPTVPLVLMDLAGSDHTTLPSSDSSNIHQVPQWRGRRRLVLVQKS
jgi:hypothetical protein